MGKPKDETEKLADEGVGSDTVKAPAVILTILSRVAALELSRDVHSERIDAIETRLGFS